MDDPKELRAFYRSKGAGRKIGFGERPAVLVVDFFKTFTDINSPFGCDLKTRLVETRRILDAARKARVSIFFTIACYEPQDSKRLWLMKQPFRPELFAPDSDWIRVDPSLERQSHEAVISKKYASAFFGTDLLSRLIAQRVDTVILTGCVTSGCVRATAVDGVSHEFHVIVAEEAVGDRSEIAHLVSLADIDARYGDVIPVKDVLQYLGSFPAKTREGTKDEFHI